MKVITHKMINSLNIDGKEACEWVKDIFLNKYNSNLPNKTSIILPGNIFYNTMPSVLEYKGVAGVKVVTRYPGRNPSLDSEIMLFDLKTGRCKAFLDGNYITNLRTGATAAVAIETFAKKDFTNISFIGLGNAARSTLYCLLGLYPNKKLTINLLKYKDQAEMFIERFKEYKNLNFVIYNELEEMIRISDVVVSCVTFANNNMSKYEWYKEGCLLVPVHVKGFENCDLHFDKVFCDDFEHVKYLKNSDKYKYYNEMSKVLLGEAEGRKNDKEKIVAYNVGLSISDIYYSEMIFNKINMECKDINMEKPLEKYWF